MLTVSNELKNAFMEPERTIYVRIKIGNRTFDNDNVVSVEYDSGSLSGEVFAIGSTYSNSFKITFSELVEGLKELDEVTYEIGIKLADNKIEYVPMGVFVINDAIEMDRNNNKTTIECMDRMVMMGGAYVSSLSYPAAIREVALEIANKAGVVVDSTSFARLSGDNIAKPEGYTYREAIGLIAQFEAGFATFNRYGKLEIRTLSDSNFAIPPDNYFSKGLVKNEVFFRLGGISCTTDDSDTVIQSGNTAGNQVVLENGVMTKFLLDKIYQKIQTINYYPFTLSWQGNPVLEAGDWVEVEDLQGNKFKTPNLSYSLSFNGGLSAKSSAETVTQSDATYQYKSPLQQKIEWIHARIDAAGGNVVYEGIDEPVNPKEGDLWFKIIGPDKEILIYKKRADGSLFWEPQISTADIDKVAKEVGAIIKQADADRAKAEQDFETAKSEAKAYTEQKSNEFNGQLEIVRADVADTVIKANDAVARANQSIADVGFMQIDLNTTKQNAIDALTKAQTATDNLNTLSFNVDELTKTVSFKAEKTTVDAVTKQVNQHELSIAANAKEIDLRLTSTQVDSLVTGKNYVNQAQLNATSTQWNLALTQVSSDLEGLEIGGRNLLLNSNKLLMTGSDNGNINVSTISNDEITVTPVSNGNVYNNGGFRTNIERVQGETYTVSFEVKTKVAMGMYWRPSENRTYNIPNTSDKWRKISFTYTQTGVTTSSGFLVGFYSLITGNSFSYRGFKLEKGTKAMDWTPAPEDMATLEQFTTIDATVKGLQTTVGNKADKTEVTQLANQWTQTTALANGHTGQISNLGEQINLRVQKGDVIGQITVEAGRTLIKNGQLVLDANTYIMGTTFANDIKAKSLDAVYADIATLKTKLFTADSVTANMVKADAGLFDKVFINDTVVNKLTAKSSFINSVKAVDIAADRITSGIFNGAKMHVINIDASAIVANTLSSITANTGALNVSDWLTFSSDNKGIRANYDFGDQLGNSFDPRWFTGSYTLGYRYMKFLADVYTVNGSGGKGNYGYYSETFYGPDYFKLRQYRNSSMTELLTRIDMRSEYISMSTSYSGSNIYLNANGDSFFSGNMQVGGDIWILNSKALKAYYVQAPDTTYNLYLNGGRNDLGSMRLGVDGSTLNGGRLVSSDSVYKRTYSSAANVVVFDTGTIGRAVSAKKYKLNIEKNDLLVTALKTLEISSSSWFDKGEVESIAGCMTKGTEKNLDPNFQLQRHYGFIADEFHDKGATEVVMYDSNGEVEGLAYDRITMYHHELIKDLYRQLDIAKKEIKQLKGAA